MSNSHSQNTLVKEDQKLENQAEKVFDESSAVQEQESNKPNQSRRALSKREIMEQLSRERFPWDE